MAYKTDGSSHRNGIKNEKNLFETLKNGAAKALYPQLSDEYRVVSKGGTKHKEDLQIIDGKEIINISAKKKDKIKSGSFDWCNGSSVMKKVSPLKKFNEEVKSIRKKYLNTGLKGRAILAVKTASLECLEALSSSDLRTILKECLTDKNKDMIIVISDGETGINYEYKFKDSPVYHSVMNHKPFISDKLTAVESATVYFEDKSGEIHDHGIRIRVVTNNGVGALIGGTGEGNKNSTAVVKIQQDNITGLISGLGNKIREF